ncbi:MAG TPA: hypothetical protein VN408_14090 [Actinoplanes sp.]|nr:hypothetical protein [Actinoplanes sp.]
MKPTYQAKAWKDDGWWLARVTGAGEGAEPADRSTRVAMLLDANRPASGSLARHSESIPLLDAEVVLLVLTTADQEHTDRMSSSRIRQIARERLGEAFRRSRDDLENA